MENETQAAKLFWTNNLEFAIAVDDLYFNHALSNHGIRYPEAEFMIAVQNLAEEKGLQVYNDMYLKFWLSNQEFIDNLYLN